ncbi:hypothetical protein VB779_17505 [Haloarculaceae archaeon H-GB11]|nr:hypothetical protein [Haloarculaceae archaeon H-GB11]
MTQPADPIEGDVLVLVAAKASVPAERLVPLVDRVQTHLEADAADLARHHEVAYETDEQTAVFVDDGFWTALGDEVGLTVRETDAVRRAHHEQLLRTGKRLDRREEFETALEIRDCVIVKTVA